MYKLYTLNNEFIEESEYFPKDFTGIAHYADSVFWYLNGCLHRLNGPAIEWGDEEKEWYAYGKRHRLDGPAINRLDGYKKWYVDGKEITKLQCECLYDVMKLKGLL